MIMKQNNLHSARLFFKLIKTNLIIVYPLFAGKILNVAVRSLCQLYVSAYVLPFLGFTNSFGLMLYATILGAIGLFECYSNIPFVL